MIEKLVLDYLESKLDVPVVMEDIKEKEYVLIAKTGSGKEEHLNSATITIQSHSESLLKAAELNELVKTAMLGDEDNIYGIAEGDVITKCTLNSDYEYTDTTTKKYRYQAVFDLTFY